MSSRKLKTEIEWALDQIKKGKSFKDVYAPVLTQGSMPPPKRKPRKSNQDKTS